MARIHAREARGSAAAARADARLCEHVVLEDPVRIGLVVDEMADAAQLRLAGQARRDARALAPASAGRPMRSRRRSTRDASACSNMESVSESEQAACTSTVRDTPARSSSGSRSAGSKVRADDAVLGRHPGHGLPLEVPEVVMCVDDHGARLRADCGPRRRSAGGLRRMDGVRPSWSRLRTCLRWPSSRAPCPCRRSSAPSCPGPRPTAS